jgi:hypothetical protein
MNDFESSFPAIDTQNEVSRHYFKTQAVNRVWSAGKHGFFQARCYTQSKPFNRSSSLTLPLSCRKLAQGAA